MSIGLILFWIISAIIVALVGDSRKIGFGLSLILSIVLSPIIGLIITLFSPAKESGIKQNHKFKEFQELGKRAEYKEEFSAAISHYKDALFHLENDYKNLKGKFEEDRINLINFLKSKVIELENKLK